jgi:hypothetical protein
VFFDCPLWVISYPCINLMSYLDIVFIKLLLLLLLSRLILYCAYCYITNNSISTLVDLWSTKLMDEWTRQKLDDEVTEGWPFVGLHYYILFSSVRARPILMGGRCFRRSVLQVLCINMAKPRHKADANTEERCRYIEASPHAISCYRTHNTHRIIHQSYT